MKTSNTIKTLTLLIFMALGTSVLFTSCKDDDPCDDQVCLNGGTCNDGDCDCPVAYEDQNCGTETRAKFISQYSCSNSCEPTISYSQNVIKSSSDAARFVVNNMGNISGLNVVARVTGGNTFTIDSQTLADSDGDTWTVSGSGSLTGNVISATVTYNWIGVGVLNCNETWTKQ
jgi:hypothetical protein